MFFNSSCYLLTTEPQNRCLPDPGSTKRCRSEVAGISTRVPLSERDPSCFGVTRTREEAAPRDPHDGDSDSTTIISDGSAIILSGGLRHRQQVAVSRISMSFRSGSEGEFPRTEKKYPGRLYIVKEKVRNGPFRFQSGVLPLYYKAPLESQLSWKSR